MNPTSPADGSTPHQPGAPGATGPAGAPRVRLSSPAGILAVVPHLLGFHPARSLVVIGAGGPRQRIELGFRYDLPDPPDATVTHQIAGHAVAVLTHRKITTVIAVGYGPGRLVTPVMDEFAATARRGGLAVRELLRVEDGRYWSYLCRSVVCCPAEGVPFDARTHPAAAVLSAAGLAAYPDRAALARTIAPLSGRAARARDEAAQRACARVAALTAEASATRGPDPLRLVITEGRRAVREAIDRYRAGGQITDADQLAWLVVSLAQLPVRDDAWARMVPAHRDAHLRLWTDLVRSAADTWLPAPAALLAFTAWQCGEGALANIGVERALAADPGYSMALLLGDILDAGVPPSAAQLPMSPEEVELSYTPAAARVPRGRRAGQPAGKRAKRPR
ncbi:MAG TPA: DUF4192 domain-containing protein [Streptosporangiaceae bacterium]